MMIYGLLFCNGGRVLRNLRAIKNLQFLSEGELGEYSKVQLERLLVHAWENVPYYRDVLEECGVVVHGSVDLRNFANIPVLTKAIIREQGERLYSRDHNGRKSYSNTSGGSTGEPVEFLQDRAYDEWNIANKLYFNVVLGKEPGDREIKLWGSDRDIISGSLTVKDRLINFLYNRRFFNSYRFDDESLKSLVELNNSFRPKAYWSYMESAVELAEYVVEKEEEFISPEILISTIGPLTEEARDKIEGALGCRVYNQYGSREVGGVACECTAQDGLHCFPWTNHIELLDGNDELVSSGEGRVVVTSLRNYSMPLIRYDIGDVAVAGSSSCSCGRGTFKLKEVVGRTLGYFKKSGGGLVHSHFIVQALFFREWLKRFQVVQKGVEHVVIRLEVKAGMTAPEGDMDDITRKVRVLMGDSCVVDYEFAETIEPSASGKYVYTICEVK